MTREVGLAGHATGTAKRHGRCETASTRLGYLEQLFPTSIGEACFIDRDGPENARMVRGVRATVQNLSPDESGASFFAPTFALRQGQVYQATPYVSPDTGEWAVATGRAPVGALYGVSGWSIAIVAVALVLLPIAAVSFLAHHRVLVAHSLTDALTGIGNRRKLKLHLERGLKEASADRPLLLMLFDLNGFKGYNDTFGHPAGDALLIRLANALQTAMTSPRSYAVELTVAAAVAELQRAAGSQFDPAVVEAFCEMAAELVWPSDRPAVADQLDPVHDRG